MDLGPGSGLRSGVLARRISKGSTVSSSRIDCDLNRIEGATLRSTVCPETSDPRLSAPPPLVAQSTR
eukprot:3023414-Prymnesium_polylepis.1